MTDRLMVTEGSEGSEDGHCNWEWYKYVTHKSQWL